MLNGSCYFLHSGGRAAVYFDATLVGEVVGDTIGNYALEFIIPIDALTGSHLVRVVGAQSAHFEVQPPDGTPPVGTFCPAENISVVPNAGPVGIRIVVSGQCYYLHSGRGGEVYFDDTRLGLVAGDTPGNYGAGFVVPLDAAPGPHIVRLRAFGSTYQSATFVVESAEAPLPTSTPTTSLTPTPTHTPTPTRTATANETGTPHMTLATAMGSSGGCAIARRPRVAANFILLWVPVMVLARRVVQKRKCVFITSSLGGRRS